MTTPSKLILSLCSLRQKCVPVVDHILVLMSLILLIFLKRSGLETAELP